MFAVRRNDIGKRLRDLEFSYRPDRAMRYVEQVRVGRRAQQVSDVRVHRGGETFYYQAHTSPLLDRDNRLTG